MGEPTTLEDYKKTVILPAVLAACRASPAMEFFGFKLRCNWCPLFRPELDNVLQRNMETRVHRERLDSVLADDAAAPAMVAGELFRVRSRPHLLYETGAGPDPVRSVPYVEISDTIQRCIMNFYTWKSLVSHVVHPISLGMPY